MFTCHYCLISLILRFFLVNFCLWWLCQCALLLSVAESQPSVVHSFSASSLAVNGGVGYLDRRSSITPTVVRRGQTDWLRRLLCGNLGGFRGPGILFSGTPLFAGLSAPHRAALHFPVVQSLPVEWMDVLRPRWDGVLVGVVMLWSRGTILLIGA